jgi:hypothetical protein
VDPSNPQNDVVVSLSTFNPATGKPVGCSGTLISPRLVLTAGHCIEDPALSWSVGVGNAQNSFITTRTSIRSWRKVGLDYEFSIHSPGQDVAVLALNAPVVNEVVIPRPKFSGGDGRPAGFAGFSPYNRDYSTNPINQSFRTIGGLASLGDLGYGSDDDNDGFHWFLDSESVGIQHGDSGGPLFYVDEDGTRQVMGVTSQMACRDVFGCNSDTEADRFYWAAVTQDNPATQWVKDAATEGARDLDPHSPAWHQQHGTSPDSYWLGEVDYTGPCDPNRDSDCDHWDNQHDNCPAVANTDQADSNDNGTGDACEPKQDVLKHFVTQDGRTISLHLSYPDGVGWARIEHGQPGDRVWIDRSYDGGRSWQGLLGESTIPDGLDSGRTPPISFISPSQGKLRACGQAVGDGAPACTAWNASVADDFNGDGASDILWRAIDGQAAIWFMNGDKLGAGYPGSKVGNDWSMAGEGDFDGDGNSDILWRASNGQVAIWFTAGGTKLGEAYPGQPGYEWRVQGVGDFDGDGRADILWRANDGQVAIWFMNGGSIAYQAYPGGKVGNEWRIEGVGDFDGDGRADILWRAADGQPAIWFMNGGNIASQAWPGGKGGHEWRIEGVGDFDDDGRADILWRAADGQVGIWFMNGGNIASQAWPGDKVGHEWRIQRVGDFDGDGRADILWRAIDGQTAVWFMNGGTKRGEGYPGGVGYEWTIQGVAPVTANDFDGDGRADILWRGANGEDAIWFMIGGTIAYQGWPGGSGPGLYWTVQGSGDFNGDGHADILWRGYQGETAIWFMNGGNIVGQAWPGGGGPGLEWQVQGIGDFDADGRADILWRRNDGYLAIWFHGDNAAAFYPAYKNVPNPVPLDWHVEGVADFNGDGRADILWRQTNGQVGVWLMDGWQFVSDSYPGAPPTSWHIQGAQDFDGDGRADILWRHDSGATDIWFMNGGNVVNQSYPGAVGQEWKIAATGDHDGDGRADILWRSVTGGTAIWSMNGGTITAQASPGNGGPGLYWTVQPHRN